MTHDKTAAEEVVAHSFVTDRLVAELARTASRAILAEAVDALKGVVSDDALPTVATVSAAGTLVKAALLILGGDKLVAGMLVSSLADSAKEMRDKLTAARVFSGLDDAEMNRAAADLQSARSADEVREVYRHLDERSARVLTGSTKTVGNA